MHFPDDAILICGHIPQAAEYEPQEGALILLVDDESIMRELGRDLLAEHGYRVLLAADGVEAIELFREHMDEISLVILDILMPRLDGKQTYLELKGMSESVKVIFCSGYAPHELIGSLLAEQSLRAIEKPFRPDAFICAVREIIAG